MAGIVPLRGARSITGREAAAKDTSRALLIGIQSYSDLGERIWEA